MPIRRTAIAKLAALFCAIAPADAKVVGVALSCGYDCSFTFGEPDAVVGDVIVSMSPPARYAGKISIAPSEYGTQWQFQVVGPGCSGNPGPCTLMTRGTLIGPFPVKYHINIKVDGYIQRNSSGDDVGGVKYFGVYGLPKDWTGAR